MIAISAARGHISPSKNCITVDGKAFCEVASKPSANVDISPHRAMNDPIVIGAVLLALLLCLTFLIGVVVQKCLNS